MRNQYARNSTFKSSSKLKSLLNDPSTFDCDVKLFRPGRTEKSFLESCPRSKSIKRDQVIDANSPNRIVSAAHKITLDQKGIDLSRVQKHMETIDISSTELIDNSNLAQSIKYNSRDECLKLFIDMRLTKSTYQIMRNNALKNGLKKLYCSYKKIQAEKLNCVPISLSCSDHHFEIDCFDLAKHTVMRLIKFNELHDFNLMSAISQDEVNEVRLECKFGLDGAQSGTNYSHHFEDEGRSDSNFVLVTMVPLNLRINDILIWTNNKPNSVNFTRPIFFLYDKESPELVKDIMDQVNSSISQPEIFELFVNNCNSEFRLNIDFKWTMVDGKVVNFASDNKATLRCNICKKTFKDFKNDVPGNENFDKKLYDFGISPLHSKLKIFEYLLNLGKKNQIHSALQKSKTLVSKTNIKSIETVFANQYVEKFWEKGAIVDRIKVGYGTTNTGPMIDRLFSDPNFISDTLELDNELVINLIKISDLLNCKSIICINEYKEISVEILKTLRTKYKFASIYPHIHKILVHGPLIIENLQSNGFGPGYYSEQSQEGLNKRIRQFKEGYARKT